MKHIKKPLEKIKKDIDSGKGETPKPKKPIVKKSFKIKKKKARPLYVMQFVRQMGRPTVMNDTTLRKLEEAFVMGATIREACLYAGIGERTYYDYIEKNKDYPQRVDELRDAIKLRAKMTLSSKIEYDGDLALKTLERLSRNEFSLKRELEAGGKLDIHHKLPPDAEQAITKAFNAYGILLSEDDYEDEENETSNNETQSE